MNTLKHNSIVYGMYARKSSESEDRQVQSIDRQLDDLNDVVKKQNLIVFQEVISERKSAFSPGREGFKKLVKLTNDGKINSWLCYHANRLSRNPIDAGTVIYLMDMGKLQHIRTPSRVYYNNPTDKMMLQIEFTMSKKDSDDKSMFVKSGLKKRYKNGLPNGKAPLGFINDKTQEKGNRGWLVDTEKFEKLKLIFSRFLKGNDSITSITKYAREELYLTTPKHKKQGGKLVNRSLMEHILKNPIYAGFFYSKDEDGLGTTDRELTFNLPKVISREEHCYLLNMLSSRTTPKIQKHVATYSGFIVGKNGSYIGADHKFQVICDCKKKFSYRSKTNCPSCGALIKTLKNPKYLSYVYYYNLKKRQRKSVKVKCIEEKKVESFLINYFQNSLVLTQDLCNWAKLHLSELKNSALEEQRTYSEAKVKQRDSLAKRKKKVREMFALNFISEQELKADYQEIIHKEQALESGRKQFNDYYDELEALLDLCSGFTVVMEKGTQQEKKNLLSSFPSNLVWDEEILSVHKPKWLRAFEKGRKSFLLKNTLIEPNKTLVNKEQNAPLRTLCPTLLGWLDTVRTYMKEEKVNILQLRA